MSVDSYARFLPEAYTDGWTPPVSTWWPWQGRSVQIARAAVPDARLRVMVIHGGGGYSGALWPLASVAAGDGVEVLAPDLPLYGDTVDPDPAGVRYADWVALLCDLVQAERAADPRPLILFGASMGGMLAYEAAARTGQVAAVVATCLLDMSDPAARAAATRFAWLGRPAPALLRALEPVLGRVRLPIRWLADMAAMSTDPRLSRLCASDPRGGGARVPLGFLADWMTYAHTAPEDYTGAPVTLVAPAADAWTPPELSIRFLQRISAPTEVVMLEGCGHFPVEEPGLTQMRDALTQVAARVAPR
ncbi:alpha/beta hydrolase [Mycolicibacterium parafortuitum]|uniref:Lysophospholipase [Nocardia brasiliensis ATCC] n=1 Tax=Mycolicibacterium parafortuitum TaxID=39692 RepID=A0A375YH30_MYCPF|nr:alpha/beta hydrolase [Mycolicibacterium parafortuitum]ORB28774.1 alpha/beta hydrolase [Mycolicibacterium parafortuitum]SRX80432.1 lysophospholipase [Nocardia brasiliensis ATCC] [Mycolicibacterium parafortuitum]